MAPFYGSLNDITLRENKDEYYQSSFITCQTKLPMNHPSLLPFTLHPPIPLLPFPYLPALHSRSFTAPHFTYRPCLFIAYTGPDLQISLPLLATLASRFLRSFSFSLRFFFLRFSFDSLSLDFSFFLC